MDSEIAITAERSNETVFLVSENHAIVIKGIGVFNECLFTVVADSTLKRTQILLHISHHRCLVRLDHQHPDSVHLGAAGRVEIDTLEAEAVGEITAGRNPFLILTDNLNHIRNRK